MKRLGKYLLIAGVLLALLMTAAGWAANRWLQSPEAHARVESEISKAAKMPLTLGKITFSAWSGLAVEGVKVPAGDGNFFEAQSLSAEPRFRSLLRGRIALGEVRIVQPRVRAIESPDGKWRLPKLPEKAATDVVADTRPNAPAPAAKPPKQEKRININVGKIMITDASVELIDKQRLPLVTMKGMNATFRDVSEESSAGEFSIASIASPDYATVGEIKGNTEHHGTNFSVRNLAANVFKGRIGGEFTFGPGTPTSAHLTLKNVDIGLAGKAIRQQIRNASGIISGDIQLAGFDAGLKAMTGNGTVVLTSGRCMEIELVRQIGQILQYAALAGFEVREAGATFRIESERIFLTPLHVSLNPLRMSASGSVGFDGTNDLVGTLSAPSAIVAKTGLVSAQFSPPDAAGMQSVQFDIKGTLDKPKQNLAAQLTGTTDRKMQRIIAVESAAESILSNFFGKKDAKPKPPAPAPPGQPGQ